MKKEKYTIKNRNNENIAVEVWFPKKPEGLTFVMHGLGGSKTQKHIIVAAETFFEKNFITVLFDTTNSFGESEGSYEKATMTNYYSDLEDVVSWSSTQQWYKEPFAMTGHSLGGWGVIHFAEKHPSKVSLLVPLAPVVSGELSFEAHEEFDNKFEEWQKTGWREDQSKSFPGVLKRLPWEHMEDRLQYDLIPRASEIIMPILLVASEKDTSCPPKHIKLFFDEIQSKDKSMNVIKNAPHTWRSESDLEKLHLVIKEWLESRV